MNFGAVPRPRAYCTGYDGVSWAAWSTAGGTSGGGWGAMSGTGYLATRFNIEDSAATDGRSYWYATYGSYTVPRGNIRTLNLRAHVVWTGNLDTGGADHNCTLNLYLLDEDPRTLTIAQIRERAKAQRNLTMRMNNYAGGVYGDEYSDVTFGDLPLNTREDFFFVIQHSGVGYEIGYQSPEIRGGMINSRPLGMEIGQTAVIAGENAAIRFENRLSDAVSLRLQCGSTALYTANVTDDSVEIACPISWFAEAGLAAENEMTVSVTASAGGDTATGSFTLQVYRLDIQSTDPVTVGERFSASLYGTAQGNSFTLSLRNGDTELYGERLTGNACSVVCQITWFTTAGVAASGPLDVTAVFTDQDGRSVSTNFALRALSLTITGDKSRVTTGLGDESTIRFTIGNRTAPGHGDGALQFILRSGSAEFANQTLIRDSASANCSKSWFEEANARTGKTLSVTAIVEDSYGRRGQYSFAVTAGADMEPELQQPTAAIVQAASAHMFPDIYIAGYSKAKISARVTTKSAAAITAAALQYGNTILNMDDMGDGVYEATTTEALSGDTVFTVIIEDERGFRKTSTVSVTDVHLYTQPSFTINTLYRCNENGDESIGGTYYRINATAVYDDELPGNEIAVFTSGVEYGARYDIESGADYILSTGFETGKRVSISVTLRDLLSGEVSASYVLTGSVNLIQAYNALVDKYRAFNSGLQKIANRITGFPALMQAYFDTIDMELFLRSGLMPTVSTASTTAAREAAKLTANALSPVAVGNLKTCSASTAASAVLGAAKCLVRGSYKVEIKNSGYDQQTKRWTGSFTVTNYSDEEDTADSATVSVTVNSDMETYIRQKINTALTKEADDVTDIVGLFKLSAARFQEELGKYAMQRLLSFRESCQACIDIMTQAGVTSAGRVSNLIRLKTGGSSSGGGSGGSGSANTQAVNRIMFDDSQYTQYRVGSGRWDQGASYTVQADGTIVFNGTASVSPDGSQNYRIRGYACIFQMVSRYSMNGLEAGAYAFSLNTTEPGVYANIAYEVRDTHTNNVGFVSPDILKDTYTDGPLRVQVYAPNIPVYGENQVSTGNIILEIWVPEGATLTDCAVRPMFESGTTAHGFTSPYTRSEWASGTAGQQTAAQQEETVDSASGYTKSTSSVINGVTVAVGADGTVTLNGTATGAFQFFFADRDDGFTLTRGHYVYSLNTTASGVGAVFGELRRTRDTDGLYTYSVQHCVYQLDDYANGPFNVIVEGDGTIRDDGSEFTGNAAVGFSVASGTSFSNYIIKPQLEDGDVLHEWVSPAASSAGSGNLSDTGRIYENLYKPYVAYLSMIDAEIAVREHEIAIVVGTYDGNGRLVADGAQTMLENEKEKIQTALDFEAFLGDTLWEEFASYRREDNLSNQNFISDGLDNAELFKSAQEYLQAAEREIRKAAESQHSIKGELHSMLTMREFQPLTKHMCVGNWIRAGVDGKVYKLRLYSYEIDYDSMGFDVEFTNLQRGSGAASDVNDLLGRVRSISASYGAVARQAESGRKSKEKLDEWEENGIPLPSRIAGSSGTPEFSLDQGGFTGMEYASDTAMYAASQVKCAPSGIYATTDAWKTGKTVVGRYTFTNPMTGQTVEGYGSIAELLIGHVLLSGSSMIFNEDGSVLITKDGITTKKLTVDGNETVTGNLSVNGTKNRVAKTADYGERLLYSYETAEPMFGDLGEGVLDGDGACVIELDPVFAQTISVNGYQVFLQRYGDGKCYVAEREGEFFVVRGTPGLRFGWEIKARQAGYEGVRLESAV